MKEIIPQNKTLSPEEYEQKLLEIENKTEQTDPLDVHAAMVKYYIPRLKIIFEELSKKQILTLATDLCGSSYNSQVDVNKIITMSKDLGLNALKRVISGAIFNPFDEVDLNLTIDKEKRLFVLFDSLLTNKYLNCIAKGLSESGENKKQELEDFILHKISPSDTLFKKREKTEKDGFLIANKLLCSKFLMIMVTTANFKNKQESENKNG